MISNYEFSKGMKELCLLIGCTPPAGQIQLFYDKLKGAELQDFKAAMQDEGMIAELGYRSKLIYPVIRQTIERHQFTRQNLEHEKLKKLSKKDFERMPEGEVKQLIRGIIKKP